ncbi:hypothetical protein DAPPUDRAFT_254653 [Daphnia pulex]|uniref:Uncharacterized protein n=1 Tax=Daphnia pulex TaxID=6669 RepID=E9H7J8_DAPPU|nr:hypothetical protein DAPPUDRAFT_254653 [Daphnia pulex]|eukprot:EFX72297.1 hypothetical protein DAPPUDRAFT_254653 [Daphnia pulex]
MDEETRRAHDEDEGENAIFPSYTSCVTFRITDRAEKTTIWMIASCQQMIRIHQQIPTHSTLARTCELLTRNSRLNGLVLLGPAIAAAAALPVAGLIPLTTVNNLHSLSSPSSHSSPVARRVHSLSLFAPARPSIYLTLGCRLSSLIFLQEPITNISTHLESLACVFSRCNLFDD